MAIFCLDALEAAKREHAVCRLIKRQSGIFFNPVLIGQSFYVNLSLLSKVALLGWLLAFTLPINEVVCLNVLHEISMWREGKPGVFFYPSASPKAIDLLDIYWLQLVTPTLFM